MHYILSQANYYSSEYTFQGVSRIDQERYMFVFGGIAPEIPARLGEQISVLSTRRFGADSFVGSEGIVRSIPQENDLPLEGLLAFWAPASVEVLKDVLANYYSRLHPDLPTTSQNPCPIDYREVTVEELAVRLAHKRILLFTGAGISKAAGLPDQKELTREIWAIFAPLERYMQDVLNNALSERIDHVKRHQSLFFESEPTVAHWRIAQLCQRYGYSLLTGNIDQLHQKTGLQPLFYRGSGEIGHLPNLQAFDYVVTIGLAGGIGELAEAYRLRNPQGKIIAINPEPPSYLTDWTLAKISR